METEKFQDLVLNHLAKLTQDMTEFNQEVNERFNKVESKIDIIQKQTAQLSEDMAELSANQQNSFETLKNMYGRHEFEITQLKQVK
jgi:chaperonin cofactor prefoldin